MRDLAVFTELLPLLMEEGYDIGDTFMNIPHPTNPMEIPEFVWKHDLIIQTTRPPLKDDKGLHVRPIYRSGHILESKLLELVGSCFISLSRQTMYLKENLARKLEKEYRDRASICFYTNRYKVTANSPVTIGYRSTDVIRGGKDYKWKKWIGKDNNKAKTCAFLIYFKAPENLGRDCLFVFGIGGEDALIFARMLRSNGLWNELKPAGCERLLDGPSRFVMVEFDIEIPPSPHSLDFVKDLKHKILINTEL
ncbi:MAG TPA: hypothetical protein PLK12_07395 [Prolixibacteraceae bacterium]|nr:hypothetical protein [Prolixibacteraceae bacterium]